MGAECAGSAEWRVWRLVGGCFDGQSGDSNDGRDGNTDGPRTIHTRPTDHSPLATWPQRSLTRTGPFATALPATFSIASLVLILCPSCHRHNRRLTSALCTTLVAGITL